MRAIDGSNVQAVKAAKIAGLGGPSAIRYCRKDLPERPDRWVTLPDHARAAVGTGTARGSCCSWLLASGKLANQTNDRGSNPPGFERFPDPPNDA